MKLLLLAAAAGLALSTAAFADVTPSGSFSGSSTESGSTVTYTTNPVIGQREDTLVEGSSVVAGGEITFSDGAVAASSGSAANPSIATSTTTISELVTNTTGVAKAVDFSSVLSSGSFGLFASTPCPNSPPATSCGASTSQSFGLPSSGTASSGFNVDVTVNGASVYSLSGEIALVNGVLTPEISDAEAFLSDFTAIEVDNRAGVRQKFFVWDDTNLDVALGDLGAGASFNVAYNLTTFSTTATDLPQGEGLIGYSAFGDPIGGGHVINAVHISTFSLATPEIAFEPVASAAPEPAGWVLMLLGIGMVGQLLRVRTAKSARQAA